MGSHELIDVDGAWIPSEGAERIEVRHTATEEVIGRVPAGTEGDVDRAARAARGALEAQADGARFNPAAPFGGYDQSGYGRRLAERGLEEMLEAESLQLGSR